MRTFASNRAAPLSRRRGRSTSLLIAAVSCIVSSASAQRSKPAPKPVAEAPVTAPAQAQVPDMMAAVPGGITADQVAARAAATSYTAKAAEGTANAAGERTAGAKTAYFPRLTLTGRYTRLSEFTPPTLGDSSFNSVVTQAPAGTLNPTPTIASPGSFRFPIVLDNWFTQAAITIPISDYFLKINQAVTAATHTEEAARFDVLTARAKSYSDGKIAYFTWLRSRGALTVALQSLAVARAHLRDSENQFTVGNASKADVLRAQTAVAASELTVERAKSGIVNAERQVRVATHAKEDDNLDPGESLDGPLAAAPTNLRALATEAVGARPEIKSIDRNAVAARKQADVARASRYPVVAGFGDYTYANPNARRFPQTSTWFGTWQLGAQIVWSPNDTLLAGTNIGDFESRANALEAQKGVVRDGIDLEVTQAYQSVVEADVAIGTTTRQLESADEGYRVARELFNAGRGTATTLIDAENALAQSRFDHLNAKVDARLARIRLEHAVGRDVK